MTKIDAVVTWRTLVEHALGNLGGRAHLSALNPEVERLRNEAGLPLSRTSTATVRRTPQQSERCESDGAGTWSLRGTKRSKSTDRA
jgi:hypothetical protein